MGSKDMSIVPYIDDDSDRSRSRSRPKRSSPKRSSPKRCSSKRSRSKSGVKQVADAEQAHVSVRASMLSSELNQVKVAKEHAALRVEAARKAFEKAQKELEDATVNDVELSSKLQEITQRASRVQQEERIQKLVDERFEAKRSRKYEKADQLFEELRAMGVHQSGSHLSWTGPCGLSGKVTIPKRSGEWECTVCDILVPSRASKCNKCNSRRPGGGGNDRDDRRRSPSYDRGARGRNGRDRGGRRRRDASYSSSDSPPRRR